MYSVFAVDDEPIVLEGIRSKIDWEGSGFTFAGEATDGELALSMIHELKPDILITDIKMPFMDGLQLSQAVKRIQPWIKIIILSGHDEFDYAKKAISIGIEDYILKPFTPEELLQSMNKAAEQIDRERKQLSDISRLKEELKTKESLVRKEFLNNLVHGSENMTSVMKKSQELNIDLISRFYKVLITRIDVQGENNDELQQARSLLNSYSDSWGQSISFFHHSNLLVCIFKGASHEELDEVSFRTAESIAHLVSTAPNSTALTALGKAVDHLSQLKDSYADAKNILQTAGLHHTNRIISSDDLTPLQNKATQEGLLFLEDSDPLVDKLKYAGKNDIQSIIEESMELIKKNPDKFGLFASYLLIDLIFSVSKLVEKLGGNIKELKPEILQKRFIEEAVQNEEKFYQTLEEVLNFAVEFRDSKMTGKYADVILKAKRYIEENYADQNTTLTTVAQAVCLSPNHFSTIFSQECKTTFIEYLTEVRIENAKRLMRESDLKGYDIAYECGFSDPHYFSYIFKKNTGLSPREYKLQL